MKRIRIVCRLFLLAAVFVVCRGQDCQKEPPVPPTAAFTADKQSGVAPLAVAFTDQSNLGGASTATYAWDFGDGATSSDGNPTHTYANPGQYSVGLTVTTSAGAATANPITITVGPPPSADSLLPVTYFHVKDSDGTTPNEGVDVALFFEPNGIADLYIGSQAEILTYTGTYSYQGGQLTLAFTADDFHPQATFALDTQAAEVTMPFRAFSTDAGTSTWQREVLDLAAGIDCVFRSAVLAGRVPLEDAVKQAADYGNAVIAYNNSIAKAPTKDGSEDDPKPPKTVGHTRNGVVIQYESGPPLEVMLAGFTLESGAKLELSPLAGDLRVNTAIESPHNGAMDPANKEALFIAPFDSTQAMYAYDWILPDAYSQGKLLTITKSYEFGNLRSFLETKGYSVRQLMNGDADVLSIAENLAQNGGYHTPGILIVSSHGSDMGSMMTGTMLGGDKDFRKAFNAECRRIQASKYASMLTYDGGTLYRPETINFLLTHVDGRVRNGYPRFMSIRTKFWEWLRTQGGDFSRSMVYLGMCNVDQNPALRESMRARTLFIFNDKTQPDMAGKTCNYLCRFLSKPTRSAEEAYYNINRISKTLKMIYAEDKIFDGVIDPPSYDQLLMTWKIFKGYGWNGSEIVPYAETGWLNDTDGASAGNIWWVLFAGRWSKTAEAGVSSLLDCWSRCWNPDPSPCTAIGETFCTNASPGVTPTQNEVAYATFLLNGKDNLDYSKTFVPRWTMNDGK